MPGLSAPASVMQDLSTGQIALFILEDDKPAGLNLQIANDGMGFLSQIKLPPTPVHLRQYEIAINAGHKTAKPVAANAVEVDPNLSPERPTGLAVRQSKTHGR